ncbi:MAG: hypothetical protein ABW321_35680 [Polyangiales bacterium]
MQTDCQAVDVSEFQMFAERVVDLSPRGMLVVCTARTCVGNPVVVSFRAPNATSALGPDQGQGELWFDAEAVVARLVEGQHWGDSSHGAGLEFTYFEKKSRQELLSRLAGYPPPVPRRPSTVGTMLVRPLVATPSSTSSVSLGVREGVPVGAFARENARVLAGY